MKTKMYKIPPEEDLNDELRPQYKVDYRKSRPNRFAGRPKIVTGAEHGGARQGAGRKPAREPLERHTITLLKSDAVYLRKLDKRLSTAIRKLIAQQRVSQ
jgi:hypothetical protein